MDFGIPCDPVGLSPATANGLACLAANHSLPPASILEKALPYWIREHCHQHSVGWRSVDFQVPRGATSLRCALSLQTAKESHTETTCVLVTILFASLTNSRNLQGI